MRIIRNVAFVALGIGIGTIITAQPRAQTAAPPPDFELVIYGAVGDTMVKCVKGCKLGYKQTSSAAGAGDNVGFACNKTGEACKLSAIGWLQK